MADPKTAFEPVKIDPLRLRNRLIKSATNEGMAPGGVPSRLLVDRHQAMAEGFECVVKGRALIHDPGLVNKFRIGGVTQSGCTACNECVAQMPLPSGTRCVLNPPNDPARNQQPAAQAQA